MGYQNAYPGGYYVPSLGSRAKHFWHVCDSLTGTIVGRLGVNSYEITEEIRTSAVGSLQIPVPTTFEQVTALNRLIRPGDRKPHGRAIAMEDTETGQILFYGPIIKTPQRSGANITIEVADWSAWVRNSILRPTGAKFVTKRDYVVTNRDQGLIMTDLFRIALEATSGNPALVVNDAPAASKSRDTTVRMFSKIGEHLDELAGLDKGIEWYTYGTRAKRATKVIGHVAAAYPERGSGQVPIRLSWKQDLRGNISGNISGFEWPGAEEVPTRVWATDANEETALWGYDQSTSIGQTDIIWENLIDLADGTTDKATATSRAKGELKRAGAFDGQLELTVDESRLGFTKLVVGDRARVEIDDGYNRTLNMPAARIVRRILTGGTGRPTQQVLTADLDDVKSPWATGLPGTAVTS